MTGKIVGEKKTAPKKPAAKGDKAGEAAGAEHGLMGTHAALTGTALGSLVGDAGLQPGFSFSPALDRLFAAGYPHLILLGGPAVREEELGAALVAVMGQQPYGVVWPANLARPLARLLPVRAVGALEPGTTTLTERGRAIFADQTDVGDEEAEELFAGALARFFSPRALRDTLWLLEAVIGERALLALARALRRLGREQWQRRPELAELLLAVPTMLLRTSPAGHAEALGLLGQIFSENADHPHQPVATERRAIDSLDLVVHGDAGRKRRFPNGIDHGALGLLWAPPEEARAAYEALAATGPGTWGPDVRRVFLAGKDMLDREAGWVNVYTRNVTESPARMLETFGFVHDPRTVSLMVQLHARRPLAKRVEAWLKRHADLSRPALTHLAEDGALAERAAELLARL